MKIVKNLFIVLFAFVSVAVIIWLNYQIIGAWFGKQGPADIGSIEVSYVSMGRFLTEYGTPINGSTWMPFWYFGFPFHLFYTPLLPFLEAFLNLFYGMPLWEAYRFVTGLGFILAPVSVFFLGWQLSKRVIGGALSGVLFSVSPTVFYWLNDGVARDKFSLDFLDPRRFTILVRWGEGPHTLSLVFVPLVGVFFARYLESQKFYWVVLAAICLGLAGLTNAIGLFSSIVLIGVMAFVRFTQVPKQRNQTIFSALFAGVLALGLISFWYNLSFINNFFAEVGGTGKMLLELFPWGWLAAIFGIVCLYFLFSKFIHHFGLAVAFLWFVVFFIVVSVYYLTETIELLPQALRYNVETDMSLSLLLGVGFVGLFDFIKRHVRFFNIIGDVVGVVIVFWFLFYIQPFLPVAQKAAGTEVDIAKTGEYEIASWLKEHIDPKKGERVFLPGNYGFYLNWFTNVGQHRGALFQASIHPWPDHMHYQLATGKNAEIARAWLTIANIKYAVITVPGTREMYKEIKNPERFANYKAVYNEQGDIIVEVPLKRPSLAKPVSISQMQGLREPKKGDDKQALLSYADWVENSSINTTEFAIVNNDTYKIKGTVGEGEGILVQMADHSGWKARDNLTGNGIAVKTDPMGFIVLYPPAGNVDIELTHGRVWQEWLGYLITLGTVVFVVWYVVILRKRHFFARISEEKQEIGEQI